MTKIIAIHQPNFFPWLGYFEKIARCNIFILFDDVQLPKTGGTWSNRVKLLIRDEARWVTAAVDRNYHGTQSICEMSFLNNMSWRQKALNSIKSNYNRHLFFTETMELIEPLLLSSESNIAKYNIQAITAIVHCLGLDVNKLRLSSDIPHLGVSNELLCSLTQLVGGDTYMCGGGAGDYQDEGAFIKNGIKLLHQDFIHPTYLQSGRKEFVPGLSIIDAAMNLGWSGVGKLLIRN